jgi:hypothetical protein
LHELAAKPVPDATAQVVYTLLQMIRLLVFCHTDLAAARWDTV